VISNWFMIRLKNLVGNFASSLLSCSAERCGNEVQFGDHETVS
jgi:hypothetical protein